MTETTTNPGLDAPVAALVAATKKLSTRGKRGNFSLHVVDFSTLEPLPLPFLPEGQQCGPWYSERFILTQELMRGPNPLPDDIAGVQIGYSDNGTHYNAYTEVSDTLKTMATWAAFISKHVGSSRVDVRRLSDNRFMGAWVGGFQIAREGEID